MTDGDASLFVCPTAKAILMAGGLGILFSFKIPAIPMGILMELFLWAFPWLVGKGGRFPESYQLFLCVFLWLVA